MHHCATADAAHGIEGIADDYLAGVFASKARYGQYRATLWSQSDLEATVAIAWQQQRAVALDRPVESGTRVATGLALEQDLIADLHQLILGARDELGRGCKVD